MLEGSIHIKVSLEEAAEIQKMALLDNRSVSAWCRMAVVSALKGTRMLNISADDNSEVILQKRDATGKFTKKGGHNDKR